MNKTAIKNFAVWARVNLIEAVKQKAYEYEIKDGADIIADSDAVGGRLLSQAEKEQRSKLIRQIKAKGYDQVMEEAAYTWFNRFIALRYMEINGFLPSRVRVFSNENGEFKPDILAEAMAVELDGIDREKVFEFFDKQDNEGLYKYLLITQCNALGECLPGMFERIENYTELLFPNNLLKADSVIGRMISDIPEEDWLDAVQIIGWMYQYYNIEPKAAVFARAGGTKIKKEEVPAATQLFTPDWIVRYMVENSLGRIVINGQCSAIKDEKERIEKEKALAEQFGWKYYLPEAEQTPEVRQQLIINYQESQFDIQSIKLIDPCMGSGHILVYAFDVLIQIYESYGFSTREAARSILKNNLFGLDIDERAYQLAYFAVMMKARQYNRRILSEEIKPNLCYIRSSLEVPDEAMKLLGDCKSFAEKIIEDFIYADEYGSMLKVAYNQNNLDSLEAKLNEIRSNIYELNLIEQMECNQLLDCFDMLLPEARYLSQKYDVVVTNPPYMAVSNASAKVNEYVKKHYPDSKADMFAVFMERCQELVKPSCYQAMITMHSWMFLSSFEKLREKLLLNDTVNMAHLGARGFEEIGGEVVQTTAFVFRRFQTKDYKGTYCRLIEPNTQQGKEDMFLAGVNRYTADQSNFSKIPGSPVAYWVSEKFINVFAKEVQIGDICFPKQGLHTGNNNLYLRCWFEVYNNEIMFCNTDWQPQKKWAKLNKGGGFRKWYGNLCYIIYWKNNGESIKISNKSVGANNKLFFRNMMGFTDITSYKPSFRYYGEGFVFDVSGPSLFNDEKIISNECLLGLLNSKVTEELMKILSPTIHMNQTALSKISLSNKMPNTIDKLVCKSIDISKSDWNAFETSWDFKNHPLV